jgi:hypothetical protein
MRTRVRRTAIVMAGGLLACLSLTGCYSKPQGGEIGVVRNGGPFDNHNIRQIIPNGAGTSWNGMFSSTHYYPVDSQQRFFRMASCPTDSGICKGADAEAVTVPSADGVDVTIEGTFYLNTGFNDSPGGEATVKAFDTQFATRTFGDDLHAYDGNDGWSAFLAAIVEPIVVNNLRETISGVTCADLVSSCALVQNSTAKVSAQQLAGKNNQSNVSRIQETVEKALATDLGSTLGRAYFKNIKFNLARVVLPSSVQTAINRAQSAFASVSQAQARVRSAKLESQANEQRQAGYRKCPTCARIDAIKALPPGLTALGSGFAVGVK